MIFDVITFDADSNMIRVWVRNSSQSTDVGLAGLVYNTSGLVISTHCDNEELPITYSSAESTIETISAIGLYAAPTAGKVRFKAANPTNFQGVYEIQLADSRLAVAGAKRLYISVFGAANMVPFVGMIPLTRFDLQASTPVVITPILVNAANPRYSTRNLAAIAQGSAPTDILVVTDGAGTAVDLTGKSLRLVVASATDEGEVEDTTDDTILPLYKYETGGNGLTVGGASSNQVTIQHSAVNTATTGQFRHWLWNTTDNILLVKGDLRIEPAAGDV